MTNLPPQAYTRDTLVKAIEWLSSQPLSVRERATTADVIVSFYMQAARRAAAQMEAPVSGENFKADLKHLANDLKQFEEPPAPPQRCPDAGTAPTIGRAPSHGTLIEPLFRPPKLEPVPRMEPVREEPASPPVQVPSFRVEPQPPIQAFRPEPPPPPFRTEPAPPPAPPQQPVAPPPPRQEKETKIVTWQVDARSLTFAKEIRERFNLSNDGEALRMLISMGAQKMKDAFPS